MRVWKLGVCDSVSATSTLDLLLTPSLTLVNPMSAVRDFRDEEESKFGLVYKVAGPLVVAKNMSGAKCTSWSSGRTASSARSSSLGGKLGVHPDD